MAKDAGDRFSSAGELAAAARKVLEEAGLASSAAAPHPPAQVELTREAPLPTWEPAAWAEPGPPRFLQPGPSSPEIATELIRGRPRGAAEPATVLLARDPTAARQPGRRARRLVGVGAIAAIVGVLVVLAVFLVPRLLSGPAAFQPRGHGRGRARTDLCGDLARRRPGVRHQQQRRHRLGHRHGHGHGRRPADPGRRTAPGRRHEPGRQTGLRHQHPVRIGVGDRRGHRDRRRHGQGRALPARRGHRARREQALRREHRRRHGLGARHGAAGARGAHRSPSTRTRPPRHRPPWLSAPTVAPFMSPIPAPTRSL